MIDYSVYMQPNPMDETAAPKAYAKAQMRENMSFSDFVNHIAQHNGSFSRGTVQGVLSDAVICLVEQLLCGNKVQLGELGSYWISLTSIGADSLESFSAANIKEVNIVFTPGKDFENLCGRATFNLVASRVAQAATLKAEKSGSAIVDLEAAKAAARANSGSGSSNTNGSNNTGGGSNPGGTTTNPSNASNAVAAPTISGNTSFTETTQVTMSAESGAEIRYTTDGSTPTAESTLYSEAITLSNTTTIKAVAIKDGTLSDVTSKTFTKSTGDDDGE